MKKRFAALLVCLLAVVMGGTALAADAQGTTLTYALSADGARDIVVARGDEIEVTLAVAAPEAVTIRLMQDEIYYDSEFFELVESSVTPVSPFESSEQTRSSGLSYVFFNTVQEAACSEEPLSVGSFRLRVKAESGETTVASMNYVAFDGSAAQFGARAQNLHVSVNVRQEQVFTASFGEYADPVVVTATDGSAEVTMPAGPEKSGYYFSHWAIGGDSTRYLAGKSYSIESDVAFSPVWVKELEPAPAVSTGGGGGAGTPKPVKTPEAPPEEPAEDPLEGFQDLDSGAWYYDSVRYVVEHGIMSGCGDGRFAPKDKSSRATIVMVLWNLEGKPVVNYAMDFADVNAKDWYAEAVRWAASEGIVGGYANGSFGPNDDVTREQLAAMLYRYALRKGIAADGAADELHRYADASEVNAWAVSAMRWATDSGLISGKADDLLAPRDTALRAEIAAVMARYCTGPAQAG